MGNNNQNIARQLQHLANSIPTMADEDLLPAIVDVCCGLLAEVQKRRPAAEKMDPIELAQLTGGYAGISGQVGLFARELKESLAPDNTQQLADSMQELEDEKRRHTHNTALLQKTQAEVATQKSTNSALESCVAKAAAELEQLKNFHESLQSMQESCTPQIVEAQKQVNAELMVQISDRKRELQDLENQQKEKEGDLENLRQDISAVQSAIDALPAENTRLLEEHDAKKALLERLLTAREDCSPEKQQELEDQIAELKPMTDALSERMAQLQNHYTRLCGSKTELDRQNQILETNVLTLLTDSIGELNLLMTEHRSALAGIKGQADDYQKSLDECLELRSGYADWCGADRKQLDAMLRAVDQAENMDLAQTLNVRNQARIRQLFRQVEENLKELDRIMRSCAAAARKDQSTIERKAGNQ